MIKLIKFIFINDYPNRYREWRLPFWNMEIETYKNQVESIVFTRRSVEGKREERRINSLKQ